MPLPEFLRLFMPPPRAVLAVGLIVCAAAPLAAAPFGASQSDTSLYALGNYVHNVVFLQDDLLRDPDDIARPVAPTNPAATPAHWTPTQLDQQRAFILEAADFWNQHPANQNFHPAARLNITVNFVNGAQPLTVADIGTAADTSSYDDALALLDPAYAGRGPTQSTRAFNRDTRDAFNTDFAWTTFVRPYEPRTASARLNGPNINAFLDSNAYIHAHEAAHIFGALDQYAPFRTDARGGYLDIPNADAASLPNNAPNPAHVESLMSTFGLFNLTGSTIEQLGWRDTDADTIPDILDTQPRFFPINLDADLDAGTLTGTLQTAVTPLESPRTFVSDATLNTLVAAEVRFNHGDWQPLLPTDGALGDAFEIFALNFTDLPTQTPGGQGLTFDARLTNSVGNTTTFSQTFGVPEPAAALLLLLTAPAIRRRRAA